MGKKMGKKRRSKNKSRSCVPQTITVTGVDPAPVPTALLNLWLSYLKDEHYVETKQ
ncbi:hypothetical protein [Escherichia phage vB_EcoM_Lh1B]|nr:hypothetical protein [Escherichia phage vB_EcoM_Lh1B]